jgi:hypothetical protein
LGWFSLTQQHLLQQCFRYIVERIWGAEIKEDKTEKDFEFEKKRKKITITQRVPFPAGSFYEGQDKKTEEMTFMLFLNSAESSRICVYESGAYFFAPPPPPFLPPSPPPSPLFFQFPCNCVLPFIFLQLHPDVFRCAGRCFDTCGLRMMRRVEQLVSSEPCVSSASFSAAF